MSGATSPPTSPETNAESDVEPLERSFTDRRPLTAAFLLVEGVLIVLAVLLFALGDPMATRATTASVIGGIMVMLAIMLAAIGIVVFVGTFLVKTFSDSA